MIKSESTVNVEGTVIDHDSLNEYLNLNATDKKTKWLVRPLILACGAGLAIAAIFASVFLVAVSIVIVPLLGIAMWAMKPKHAISHASEVEADTANKDKAPVADNDGDNGVPNPA